MRELTPQDKHAIEQFKETTGSEFKELDRYLSGQWEWYELWDYNFDTFDSSQLKCRCKFEGLRAYERRKGYPLSIQILQDHFGFSFTLIGGGGSWYVDAYYKCSCGQLWKEVFVEAMQYNGNHAFPIDDDEFRRCVKS